MMLNNFDGEENTTPTTTTDSGVSEPETGSEDAQAPTTEEQVSSETPEEASQA